MRSDRLTRMNGMTIVRVHRYNSCVITHNSRPCLGGHKVTFPCGAKNWGTEIHESIKNRLGMLPNNAPIFCAVSRLQTRKTFCVNNDRFSSSNTILVLDFIHSNLQMATNKRIHL